MEVINTDSFASRILQLRKSKNLSQADFAKAINLSQNFVWMVEKGQREPSDRTISDICRVFSVNEIWLRTGEGEPFQEESRQEAILRFATQTVKGSDEFRKSLVYTLSQLDAEDWQALSKLFRKLSDSQNEK